MPGRIEQYGGEFVFVHRHEFPEGLFGHYFINIPPGLVMRVDLFAMQEASSVLPDIQ